MENNKPLIFLFLFLVFICISIQNEPGATTQINTNTVNYGATGHVANNPFASAGAIIEEPVQPEATDTYMHANNDNF